MTLNATLTDVPSAPDVERPTDQATANFYQGMRPFWHPVLREADLGERKTVRVEVLGVGIAFARLNGEIRALRDLCRHFQAKLSLGEIIDLDGPVTAGLPTAWWST